MSSTTSTSSLLSDLLGKFSLSYWGMYSGPPAVNPLQAGTLSAATGNLQYDPSSPQNLYNQLKLDYHLSQNVFIGPVLNFKYIPVYGKGAHMEDSGVRIGNSQLIHTDHLNLFADARIYAPTDPHTQSNGEIVSFVSLQFLTYEIPATKWTLGLLSFDTYGVYGSNIPVGMGTGGYPEDAMVYLGPNISYQLTPSLALTTFVEFYMNHAPNSGLAFNNLPATYAPMDIAPGVSWDITKQINISPQLVFYPEYPTLSSIGTVVYLSAKVL